MLNKNFIEQNSIISDTKIIYKINYYITSKAVDTGNLYGIQIDKLDINSNLLESDYIENLSFEYDEILKLTKLLIKNNITPISLINIIDDLTL